MRDKIKKWLRQSEYTRRIYAVREGSYKGHFLVFVSETGDDLNFLILPDNDVMSVPKDEFVEGVNKKIVDYIQKLPNNVYEICCAQYNESKAKSDINRLKQSATSDGVDS